jgi:hypothetical protein
VALAFMAAIEDINRFRRMRSVGAYLGLTARRYQSNETDCASHLAAEGRDGAPLSLRGRERAPDHGQEIIGARPQHGLQPMTVFRLHMHRAVPPSPQHLCQRIGIRLAARS